MEHKGHQAQPYLWIATKFIMTDAINLRIEGCKHLQASRKCTKFGIAYYTKELNFKKRNDSSQNRFQMAVFFKKRYNSYYNTLCLIFSKELLSKKNSVILQFKKNAMGEYMELIFLDL